MKEDGYILKREMHWPTVLVYIHLHILGLYGLWLIFSEAKWLTVILAALLTLIGGLGVTAGAHRLWAHRSYTASTPLRFFLMIAHTLAGVGSVHDWVLSHRIHHKYYGTELDPYNHKNGFIYSHIFSNLLTTHPDQEKISRNIDMRDIEGERLLYIQNKLYLVLMPLVGVLLPINMPVEYWDESIVNAICILGFLRFAITVNISWLVNSGNLIWGLKPGQKYPADDNSIFFVIRSYWPHYHYMVPWDYKIGEFGTYDSGCSTTFIKIWEVLGLAWGLKTADSLEIRKALFKSASTGVKIDDCLQDVHDAAELETIRKNLGARH